MKSVNDVLCGLEDIQRPAEMSGISEPRQTEADRRDEGDHQKCETLHDRALWTAAFFLKSAESTNPKIGRAKKEGEHDDPAREQKSRIVQGNILGAQRSAYRCAERMPYVNRDNHEPGDKNEKLKDIRAKDTYETAKRGVRCTNKH